MEKNVGKQIKEWEQCVALLMIGGFVLLDLLILYWFHIHADMFMGILVAFVFAGIGYSCVRTVGLLLHGYGELLECVKSIEVKLTNGDGKDNP